MPPSAEKIDVLALRKKAEPLKHAAPPPENQFRNGVRIGRLIEAQRQQEAAQRKRKHIVEHIVGLAAVACVIIGAIYADDILKHYSMVFDHLHKLIDDGPQSPHLLQSSHTVPADSVRTPALKPPTSLPKPNAPPKQGLMVAKEKTLHCLIEIQGRQAKPGSQNPELLNRLAVAYQQLMSVDVIDERLYQAKSAIEKASPEMCNTLCAAQSAYPQKKRLHNQLICQDIDSVTKSVSPSRQ